MATLKFKGPFHWDHLISKNPSNPCGQKNSLVPPKKPGIYIWGFMFDLRDDELNNPLDYNDTTNIPPYKSNGSEPIGVELSNCKFIPYYVGKDKSLFDRIINHHEVRTNDSAVKYLRLNLDFYKEFFKSGSGFKIYTGNNLEQYENNTKLILANKKTIEYSNNVHLLYTINNKINQSFWPKSGITDIPITNCYIDGQLIPDTLDFLITKDSKHYVYLNPEKHSLNNFWFCYATLSNMSNEDQISYKNNFNTFMNNLEAQTFYSLKGKTISKTLPYRIGGFGHTITCDNNGNRIMNPCIDIFKKDINGDITTLDEFKGYLNNNPY